MLLNEHAIFHHSGSLPGTSTLLVRRWDGLSWAVLFNQRCSGCHTLDAANARGSKPAGQAKPGERTDGPNFNVRKENRDDVLFAIRNGGFSGSIMPANVVVGKDAQDVALFVERYAGRKGSSTSGGKSASGSGG